MTDLMDTIYHYLLEARYKSYLPQEYYWHHQRVLEATEHALAASLSPEQWALLEKLTEVTTLRHEMELEAMFHTAWQTARQLD